MAMSEDFAVPVAKRPKFEKPSTARRQGSRLFAPFRTVGLVSPTSVPFTSVPLGKTTFQITTSVGRSLQTYDLRRGLSLAFLSRPQCPDTITATCAYRDRVFVAWGGRGSSVRGVWIFKRGRYIGELETPSSIGQEIRQIAVFGSWIIGCGTHAVEVWKIDTNQHYTSITPPGSGRETVLSGHVCTIPTLLNKVLVGRADGNVEIYNVSTGRLLYTLPRPSSNSGSVTALAQAPALCLVVIAYMDGTIVMRDAETDEEIMRLRQSTGQHPVTCITFRTDGAGAGEDGRQDGVMATSSIESGDVTLWDLNRGGRVVGVLRGAHEMSRSRTSSGVNKIEFLAGQPVIVSTGLDNALRTWILDQAPFRPIPRLLHARSGHAAPATQLKFLPAASDGSEAAGKWLLSAGQDRSLWGFSLRKDAQSTELSQGSVKHKAKKIGGPTEDSSNLEDLKAPPIIALACSLNRDGGMGAATGPVWANIKSSNAEETNMTGWESVLTAHEGDRFARTWFWGRKKAGRWAFESSDRKPVTSVAITSCGTFALIGSAGGALDMFNLQSGVHRQRFPPRPTLAQAKILKQQQLRGEDHFETQRGHTDGITGIVVDNVNKIVLSSSLDGSVRFWLFSTGALLHSLSYNSAAPTAMRYNSVSGLVSLACDDLCIRVVDMETKRTVRELWGCVGQIYDHCFSHDGRWVVACSMDSVIRVFDLATGHLIDAFRTATCTNVAFSTTGEFLAIAHAGSIGINIWNNKTLFKQLTSHQVDEENGIIDLTASSDFQATAQLAVEADEEEESSEQINGSSDLDQLDAALLTLSLVPKSRWQTLLNLESIRQRNRPIQPPEKPKAAPFFLGSSLTNGTKDNTQTQELRTDAAAVEAERSRVSRLAALQSSQSPCSALLNNFARDSKADPSDLVTHMTTLPPSAADLEIRSLALSEMPVFVRALAAQLRLRKDFELVNTWMSVFLKVHGDFVGEVEALRRAVMEWKTVMEEEERRLGELVGYTKGVVDFLRSAR